jgi:hypothetical protein
LPFAGLLSRAIALLAEVNYQEALLRDYVMGAGNQSSALNKSSIYVKASVR